MNNKDNDFKSKALDQILDHFAEERDLLSKTVKGIEEFASSYKEIKTILDEFKGEDNLSVSNSLLNINSELISIDESVKNYNTNLAEKYTEITEDFKNLFKKYDVLLESQKELTSFIEKIDNFMETLNSLNMNEIINSLNENERKVERLNELVEKDLKEQIKHNNEVVGKVVTVFDEFIKTNNQQQMNVKQIADETQATNKLLKELSKSNNINEGVLFELMDKWAEDRKRNKK